MTAEAHAGSAEGRRRQGAPGERDEHIQVPLDATVEGLLGLDTDGRCTFANAAAVRLLGYQRATELVGTRVCDFVHPQPPNADPHVESECRICRALAGGRPAQARGESFRRATEGSFPVDYWLHPIKRGGRVAGAVLSFLDVSERRGLEERARDVQRLETIGQLAAGVAHDFNNLLTTILGYAEHASALLHDNRNARQALEHVVEAAERAAGVSRALLTFSQKVPARKKPVNLHAVVEDSLRLLRRVLPSTIAVEVDQAGESPVWVHADATQLLQVVINLAISARDAMPDGGTLRLSVSPVAAGVPDSPSDAETRKPWAQLRLTHSDRGPTLDGRRRVSDQPVLPSVNGADSGLSLAIIDGIVRDHGGQLELHSKADAGTTISIVLPRIPSGAAPEAAQTASPTSEGQGELILLAEDDRHIRAIIAATLEAANHDVVDVAGGPALLTCFERLRSQVRLLVVDLGLPGQGGLECLRRIRASGARTPAIAITGTVDAGVEDQLDPDTVLLRKPFQMAEFTGLVASVLRTPRRLEGGA